MSEADERYKRTFAELSTFCSPMELVALRYKLGRATLKTALFFVMNHYKIQDERQARAVLADTLKEAKKKTKAYFKEYMDGSFTFV